MSRNINNIDDLLRDSFEDFSSAPSPAVRAKVSKSIKNFNFLRFNPGSFNVFYLAAIVLGTSVVVSISAGVFSSGSEHPGTTKNAESGRNSDAEKSVIVTNSEKIVHDSEIADFEENIEENNNFNVPQTVTDNYSDLNVFEKSVCQSDNSEAEVTVITETDSIPEEKLFVFDTIVETVKIVITDTIKTEVRKTVEMKKNRRNQK